MREIHIVLIIALSAMLMLAATQLPEERSHDVADYYMENALDLTGSANIVNSIVWDFRGYDTLGEETVLFSTVLAVFLIVHQSTKFNKKKLRRFLRLRKR